MAEANPNAFLLCPVVEKRWVSPSALPNLQNLGFANLLAKTSALKNPERNGTLIKGNDLFVKLKGWFRSPQIITGIL